MITFEETIQTVLNLVAEREQLRAALKAAEEKIKQLELRVREPDAKKEQK